MTIFDLLTRSQQPVVGDESHKIPWHEPAFSQRMLDHHLSQTHDWASRRELLIDRHLSCITRQLPSGASILDLGCGPGLYTAKLAKLGYVCTGVDIAPASIAYAEAMAKQQSLAIEYLLADMRTFTSHKQYDAVLLLFGEINVFSRSDAQRILSVAVNCLRPGGKLFMEVHTFEAVKQQGHAPATWKTHTQGLFSSAPHLCLQENFWDEACATATTRYWVVDAVTANCTPYLSAMCAYTEAEYDALFQQNGLSAPQWMDPTEWPAGADFTGRLKTVVAMRMA